MIFSIIIFLATLILPAKPTTYETLLDVQKYPVEKLVVQNTFQAVRIDYAGSGEYIMYLSATTFDQFYGQFNHEICHTKNISLYDAYVEGICSFYAKLKFDDINADFSGWRNYYLATYGNDVYAAGYFMMESLHGRGINVFSMFDHITRDGLAIDIDAWLKSLNTHDRGVSCYIVKKYWYDLAAAKSRNLNVLRLEKPSCI